MLDSAFFFSSPRIFPRYFCAMISNQSTPIKEKRMEKDKKVLVVELSKKGMGGRWREMEKKDRRGHFLDMPTTPGGRWSGFARRKSDRTGRAASPFSVPHFTTPKLKRHLRCSMSGSIVYKLQTSSTGIASTRALCLVPTSKAKFYASLLFHICYTQERSVPLESPPQSPPRHIQSHCIPPAKKELIGASGCR